MKVYNTAHLHPDQIKSQTERDLIYNGLDCVITAEVLEVLLPQLDNMTASTYAFSRDLQAPVLDMRLRGVKIDVWKKAEVIEGFHDRLDHLETNLERIVREGLGFVGFNWRSIPDLKELFYDRLRIPVIRRQGRPTVNRDALEKLSAYRIARPIISYLTAMRDLGKKISVLQTEVDPDGRMRTSYNIGGTTTGRLSSSLSEFGTGTNLQNIEESLREIFIADRGMKMAYIDAEQGESRVVGAIEGNLFGAWDYLDACEGGDLHTRVAKLVWPDLAWPGDPMGDRKLAETPYYRDHDRRFMCKKIGHGTNYAGRPPTLASQAKVDVGLVESFQQAYFKAFPAHRRWHAHVQRELLDHGVLVSLTGRKRQFWGRRNDDAVLREAIAYDPQGSLADIVNNGMLQVWRAGEVQLLMQVHDAIVVQYPERREDEVIPRLLKQILYPIELRGGRKFIVPYGCATGWNFGKWTEKNPDGLKSYAPNDKRRRQAEVNVLDRIFRKTNS